jgi:hypothetical protein
MLLPNFLGLDPSRLFDAALDEDDDGCGIFLLISFEFSVIGIKFE